MKERHRHAINTLVRTRGLHLYIGKERHRHAINTLVRTLGAALADPRSRQTAAGEGNQAGVS